MLGNIRLVRRVGLAILIGRFALPLHAQTVAPMANAASVASDPDVLGAERLFSVWIEEQIAYRGLPGIAVDVVSNQELVWSKGFGFADIKPKLPMTAATKFRMASNSKLFTAIAIMQLREEGKLGQDDPVVKYLPWFKAKPAGDDDGPITIEQLLSHNSGLQREASDHWASCEFPTTEEIQRWYANRQAAFAPSVRWKYSNLAFGVAGLVVEKVSGQRWADYVERNIFKPLGMNASSRSSAAACRACSSRMKRHWAGFVVKVLPPDVDASVSIDRFRREIQLAAQLQHPHIVPLLSAGETAGLPYFTMPFVKGKSLRARLTHGALGTPAYTAPEQATADPNTNYRADIYALGVVANEMLTASTPFPDDHLRRLSQRR